MALTFELPPEAESYRGGIREFLIEPVATLGLDADVYGVRYPAQAQKALAGRQTTGKVLLIP